MSQALLLSSGQERPDTRAARGCGGSKCKYGLAALPASLPSLGLGSQSQPVAKSSFLRPLELMHPLIARVTCGVVS